MKEGLTAKVQIMVEPSLIQRIDDWRYTNRVSSRSHAMRQLIALSLENEKAKGPAETAISPSHGSSNPR